LFLGSDLVILHDKMERGEDLTPKEQARMVALERQLPPHSAA